MTANGAANQMRVTDNNEPEWSSFQTNEGRGQTSTYGSTIIHHFCSTYQVEDFVLLITERNKARGREEVLVKTGRACSQIKTRPSGFSDWQISKRFENTYTPASFNYSDGRLTIIPFEGDGADEFPVSDKRERALFDQLHLKTGYCIPLLNGRGDRALAIVGLETMPQTEILGSLYFKLVKIFETLSFSTQADTERMAGRLTSREIECLKWVADGKTSLEIAAITSLSVHTINHYLKICCSKLNTVNRIQAAVVAARQQLI